MDPLELLRGSAETGGDPLTHLRQIPARGDEPLAFPRDLPEILVERLGLLGVRGLYAHQRRALERVRGGHDVMIATGTASGKTLVYNLAFAVDALNDPKRTALYLYPTKALARDQLRQIRELRLPQLKAAVYDGDTPRAERPLIRRNANLVLTNPDMLHASLLPDHPRWADFFLRLSLVVVDEAHVCRGVFGSHVSMVLRRLRRLVAHYGGEPRFVLSSATVGNPAELAERLVGVPFEAVTEDASPSGGKTFALWNPPVIDEESGARRSALSDASAIMARLAEHEVRSIGFTRSRRAAELLAEFTRRALPSPLRERVKSYRAGYLSEDRRELERQLAAEELLAVASTNALELGIDIGTLDAAILVGYPGTRASMWQQAGRAGRRADRSLAVLVAQDDPLDQYLVSHPADLFDAPPEAAVIDPRNPFILEPHLRCAAAEHPLADEELAFFGPDAAQAAARLETAGALVRRRGMLHHAGRGSPHRAVDIRSASGDLFQIVIEETGELLGTVDESRAYYHVHPGAVYLHQGEQFEVLELDLVGRVALVRRSDPDFYTQSRDTTDIAVVGVLDETVTGDVPTFYGTVRVTNQVVAFVRKLVATGETLELVPLALPAQSLETKAVWWAVPTDLVERAAVTRAQLPGAAHAAEHAVIGLLPLVATCDRWDVGGVSTAYHPDTDSCAIFVYDGYPGGAGIAERGFRSARRLLEATLETVRGCPCGNGCPACVQSPKCGNGNEPLDKAGAVSLLAAMLGRTWG
ncbi:MAG TPA: DEAD/DEAH box helicase [Actinomycetota bacterium]|jgi:DEAD/DEAH box helicase domain-containing protein|nr:DEAD/DEAH box helicase [Actinomycetota bacterium]